MLASKYRLPIHSARQMFAAGLVNRQEQKRHATLNMQTLNPLVKEVEYAVRGKQLIFLRQSFALVSKS
jgi:hypothetical protein